MKNRKNTLVLAGAAIVILAAAYFVGVPMMHVSQQKAVNAKHNLVNDKLGVVYASFKRDVFTKADAPWAAPKPM